MRKSFWLSITLILVLLITIGCGNSTNQTNPGDETTTNTVKEWAPEKEIKIIVPWSAGGAADSTSRKIQSIIKQQSGIDVVVEVIEGGSGSIGLTQVMESKDGYTVGYASSTWLAQLALDTVPFEWDDCAVASTVFDEAFVIIVPKDSPYESAEELMSFVKENPDKVTLGGAGSGNVNQTLPVLLGESVGSSFNYTSFDGASRVMTEILGGHSDAAIIKPFETLEYVKNGDVRVLGVFGNDRLAVFPDAPTFVELGYDVYNKGQVKMHSFFLAPASAKEEVLEGVGKILNDAISSDEFQQYCDDYAFIPPKLYGAEARKYVGDIYEGIEKIFVELYK